MTVKQIVETLNLNVFSLTDEEREVTGAYIGDLLSWVMGRAPADSAWITIMSNVNVVAVASLADVACVIFAEGVEPDEQAKTRAENEGINLMSSTLAAYELSVKLSALI
jgi:serine kinase of HPr protein (carbohydrate metabolism regulator)